MKLSKGQFRLLIIYLFSVWAVLTFIWAVLILRKGMREDLIALIAIIHLLGAIFSIAMRKSM